MPECFETWREDAKADDERRLKSSKAPDEEEQMWQGFLAPEDQEEEDWDNWLDYVEFVIVRDLDDRTPGAGYRPKSEAIRAATPATDDDDDDDDDEGAC